MDKNFLTNHKRNILLFVISLVNKRKGFLCRLKSISIDLRNNVPEQFVAIRYFAMDTNMFAMLMTGRKYINKRDFNLKISVLISEDFSKAR